ncbi:histidine ammonia-lyase [Burkholderia ubonensis]|uniref:hypothetical protein n=1 Tax=Burkholderia ubonensis TaxID=101571 RepID=UPI0007527A63|nr:hypothetical protein [Burkholderia ubonensis]KVO84034.1 histidine ammonia-lyase [Burkholderia ubonensis]KVR24002.1 histidine ammonia-lyase [Burkholderia ubonensis]KWD25608.1 histidine ammonia-lyase [Burkholderia ubonensis]KWD27616.1 histidine ammonia-lyase [Burkholderia ubonensis]
MSRLPINGDVLANMRKGGAIPRAAVLVSLVGPLRYSNVTLLADPSECYDWRIVGGLDIEVITSVRVPLSQLLTALAEIAAGVPARMVLTYREGLSVECGEWRQVTDFKVFDWFPMPLAHAAWGESRKLAHRLLAAVGKELPIPYDEALNLVIQLAEEGKQWLA